MPLTPAAPPRMRDRITANVRAALGAIVWAALVLSPGCDSKNHCSVNTDCPSGYACQQNQCISILSGRTLGVEILPPSDSVLARTEYSSVTFLGTSVALNLDATSMISGIVQPAVPPTMYSSDAHVQVTIPSRMPGRAAQQTTVEMAMDQFMFGVGTSRVGTVTASFLFTPGTTSSQGQPPVPLSALLTQALEFTFPSNEDMTVVRGQLLDDQNNPLAGYLARAFYQSAQGQQVSNTFPVLSDGTFALLIPPGAVPVTNDTVVLTMTPPPKSQPSGSTADTMATTIVDLPQFVSSPVPLKSLAQQTMPPVYVMPSFIPATAQLPFTFTVLADDEPQSGVSLRFTMNLPLATGGSAYFQASATSDSSGTVTVPLVPGTVDRPVTYQVMIQGREATYGYASQCVPALPVNLDATGALPAPVPFILKSKVQLSGTVSDSMSAPAVNALVSATQISGVTDCGADAAPPPVVSAKTGAGGDYKLLLDPGTYRIELDPPPSTMVNYPRTILDGANAVTLSGALVRNIPLPAGSVAMGSVSAPDGTPVPMASVEIFEVFCREANCGAVQPPVSLAVVTTDALGNFQTVLPTLP